MTMTCISVSDARTLLSQDASIVILDVRTPEEFKQQHLPHAVNMDCYEPSLEDNIGKLDPQTTYLIYCHSGARAQWVAQLMEEMGFGKVYAVVGYLF